MKKDARGILKFLKSIVFPNQVMTVSHRGLTYVPLSILQKLSGPEIRELYLGNNNLTNVEPLARAIKRLHVLDLYGNRIRVAPFANVQVDELYLGHNQLTTQGLKKLFPTKTKELYLSNNKITDEGLKIIAQGLKNNKTLTHLSLHHNNIKNIQPLIDILPTTNISSLDLQANNIDDEGARALADTQLWDIDLSDNPLITFPLL